LHVVAALFIDGLNLTFILWGDNMKRFTFVALVGGSVTSLRYLDGVLRIDGNQNTISRRRITKTFYRVHSFDLRSNGELIMIAKKARSIFRLY